MGLPRRSIYSIRKSLLAMTEQYAKGLNIVTDIID